MSVKVIGKHEKDSRACRDALALTLNEMMAEDKSIVYVDCDLMGCINTKMLRKNYPDRAFEAGIAEANGAGVAAGLAAAGKKVFFHSFGTFSSRRCYDQIYMSAAYAGLPVHVLGSDAGVTAAFNGGTHMPLEDGAMYLSIPESTVLDPADYAQLESITRQLPGITKGLMAVSGFFQHYWWTLLLAALAIGIVRLLLRRSESGRLCLAAGKLKRSPLRRLHQMSAASQFAATMATMLTAGLPVTRSLEVTAGVVSNDLFADAVRRVRQGVEQGRDLADCMLADPTFPRLLTEMTGVGERSGNLEQTLTVIGDYFDNEVGVMTQRLLSLLEPAITIALAIITVVLLLAVYLPMFTMYGSIL